MQQKRLDYELNKNQIIKVIEEILNWLRRGEFPNSFQIEKILRKFPSPSGEIFSKSYLITSLPRLQEEGLLSLSIEELEKLGLLLRMKKTRTISGVTPLTVLTKPFPCPGKCVFCPSDTKMPKSYLSDEPGAQRAISNKFDPYLQTYNRLVAFKNTSHPIDKIELIILGGTWSSYPESYQIWFVKRCFDALNDFENNNSNNKIIDTSIKLPFEEEKIEKIDGKNIKQTYNQIISRAIQNTTNLLNENSTWEELFVAHKKNQISKSKCVGLVIETRPDEITKEEVLKIRKLGATKIQIGVQSLDDEVLKLNKRGHLSDQTRTAFSIIRSAGFKIHAHIMPNLYGSTPEKDIESFEKLFKEKSFRPDELKIYPCSLIASAELMQIYENGLWEPYSFSELQRILSHHILFTPRYCRLTRIIRDIPSTDIVVGNKLTNFRQVVEKDFENSEAKPIEIRSREIRDQKINSHQIFKFTEYETDISKEYFLEFVGEKDEIYAFLRLSIPANGVDFICQELENSTIIREVHVYGQSVEVGKKTKDTAQHLGFGKSLIREAENISRDLGFKKIAVISAIGTREYYTKLGFEQSSLYQTKEL